MSWNPPSLKPDDVWPNSNGNNVNVNKLALQQAGSNYIYDVMLMQQRYDYDDTWWNEHDSPAALTAQLKALGYSDAYIAQFLNSNGGSSTQGDASFTQANGDNPAESVAALNNAISGSANSVSNAVQADTAAQVGQAQVENLKSQANKNNVDAGLAPSIAASQNTKNYSSAALDDSNVTRNEHLNNLTDKEIDDIGEKINLTKEQIINYQKQNYWYDSVTVAELNESQSRCLEFFTRSKLNLANVDVAKSEVNLNEELANESVERQYKTYVEAQNIAEDTKNKSVAYDQAKYEFDYMVAHDGIKLDMDTQQKVGELIARGKLDEAEAYLMGQYKFQLFTRSGDDLGTRYKPSAVERDNDEHGTLSTDIPGVFYRTLDAVGGLSPFMYLNSFGRGGVTNYGKAAPPSYSNSKPTSSKPIPNRHYNVNGHDWRIDNYGNIWVDGKMQ